MVPPGYVLDGSVREWEKTPPITNMGVEARDVVAWAGRSPDGLVVAGRTPLGPTPDFPSDPPADSVTISLALVRPFSLPEIEFSDELCRGMQEARDRAACHQWRQEQIRYRGLLRKQFARVWKLVPGAGAEEHALPAFDELDATQRGVLRLPRPAGVPESRFQKSASGIMEFEVLIRWELLPPADQLTPDQLRLGVETGAYQNFEQDKEDPLRTDLESFTLWPRVTTQVTACGQPLFARDAHGRDTPLFYFLRRSHQIDRAFFFENFEYSRFPRPGSVSPYTREVEFFSQPLGPGEYLCGPFLSYRKGAVVKAYPYRLEPPGDMVSVTGKPPRRLPVHRQADGTRLIRYGPDVTISARATRSITVNLLVMYALTPSGELHEALTVGAWSDGVQGYGLDVSKDGRTVKEYRQDFEGKWSARTYCLAVVEYKECGKEAPSAPPPMHVWRPEWVEINGR